MIKKLLSIKTPKLSFLNYKSYSFSSSKTNSDSSNLTLASEFAISSQYDPTHHTLLKNLFIYRYRENYYGYLIFEEKTKSIIAIDPGDYIIAKNNIELLEIEKKAKLTCILSTHHHENHNGSTSKFKAERPDIDVIIGNYGKPQAYFTKKYDEIKPFSIGDICICIFYTPGHTNDSCCFVITQVNPNSTKTPLVFTGDTLYIGSCGRVYNKEYYAMYGSLNKLKNLPNETLIFPGHDNALNNLVWVKTIDPNNDLLNMRLEFFEKMKKEGGFSVPTTMFEEKRINPFLRCHERYFQQLLNENDPKLIFTKLKKAQDLLFKLQQIDLIIQ